MVGFDAESGTAPRLVANAATRVGSILVTAKIEIYSKMDDWKVFVL